MNKQERLKKMIARKKKDAEKKKEKNYINILSDAVATPYQRMLTGLLTMDYLLHGLMEGSMYELCGRPNSGKSALSFKILEKAQYVYPGLTCYYNDIEGTSKDETFLNRYPLLKRDEIIFDCNPDIETFFTNLEEMSSDIDLLYIDTVGAMKLKNDIDLEKAEMGKVAGIMTRGWKRFFDIARDGIRVFAINQVREQLNQYAANEGPVTPGATAFRHAVTGKIEIKRDGGQSKAIKNKDVFGNEKVTAWDTIIKVWKNKQGPFGKSITTYFHTEDSGENKYDTFDEIKELIAFSKVFGLIISSGSMNSIINPETGEEVEKIKGKDALEEFFKNNPEKAAELKIYCYRNILDNSFFYCLYDKILMIARADIVMQSIRNKINFNIPFQTQLKKIKVDEEKVLEELKEKYPITKFFEPEQLKELEKEYDKKWLWKLREEVEDEEIEQ